MFVDWHLWQANKIINIKKKKFKTGQLNSNILSLFYYNLILIRLKMSTT